MRYAFAHTEPNALAQSQRHTNTWTCTATAH